MIRVGILGCANIACRSVVPSFFTHDAFEVAAIASRSLDKAVGVSAQYQCRACGYEELVKCPEVDLVYCPLPTGMHYEWVKKALESGKHVLCEKSLATTYGDVSELVNIARAHHCFLMESFQFRFHAQNIYVKNLLAANAIGSLHQVAIRFGIPPFTEGVKNIRYSKELGGGALLDNGAYTVKCATYLLGNDVEVLASLLGGNTPELGNVDLVGAIMMKSGNVPVHAAYGFDHYYQNSYEIWGSEGRISTTRAFTARADFPAPVILETKGGKVVNSFQDDHFARLMDYLATTIPSGEYEFEYQECLNQARIMESVAKAGGM